MSVLGTEPGALRPEPRPALVWTLACPRLVQLRWVVGRGQGEPSMPLPCAPQPPELSPPPARAGPRAPFPPAEISPASMALVPSPGRPGPTVSLPRLGDIHSAQAQARPRPFRGETESQAAVPRLLLCGVTACYPPTFMLTTARALTWPREGSRGRRGPCSHEMGAVSTAPSSTLSPPLGPDVARAPRLQPAPSTQRHSLSRERPAPAVQQPRLPPLTSSPVRSHSPSCPQFRRGAPVADSHRDCAADELWSEGAAAHAHSQGVLRDKHGH